MEIAECVGGAGLAGVCRLLAQDHAGWAGEHLHRFPPIWAASVLSSLILACHTPEWTNARACEDDNPSPTGLV